MRILFVAISDSIHTARWISQITEQGWDIHLFPSIDCGVVHPEMRNVTVYYSVYSKRGAKNRRVKVRGVPIFWDPAAVVGKNGIQKLVPDYRVMQLRRLIKKLNPDVIHSLEMQHAGYLTLEVKRTAKDKFPCWIATNWGSDIYLFGRLREHEPKIRKVLSECDYYSCECQRDVGLAKAKGFNGKVLPVFPNTGGFDLELVVRLRQPGQVSSRRLIMLKGYQNWSGRALVGLRALERCADILKGYEVAIYSASHDVLIAAELFQKATGVAVRVIPKGTAHKEILHLHGHARISIALGISDAISTSLLEALVMGAFPIQSWTSCADEWVKDGKTGMLVPPDDPEVVEKAIRTALSNDELVNRAAEHNHQLATKKLDRNILTKKTVDMYNFVFRRGYHG